MKNRVITILTCALLCSCVSNTKYSEALNTIDSLRVENARLADEVDELRNGEERLIAQYQESFLKGFYIRAEETYERISDKFPGSSLRKELSNISQIREKAKYQRDSIDKARRDSVRLANLDSLGSWQIGDYFNDFKEPTGEHFIYQVVYGEFSNSATAGSRLKVIIRLSKSSDKKAPVNASIEYDEYSDGVIDETYIGIGGKVVCMATRTVYNGSSLLGFYDNEKPKTTKYKLSFAELLRLEQTLEFTDSHKPYTNRTYKFSIDCQFLNNALLKAGILSFDDI